MHPALRTASDRAGRFSGMRGGGSNLLTAGSVRRSDWFDGAAGILILM